MIKAKKGESSMKPESYSESQINWIIGSSVEDARSSLQFVQDSDLVTACIQAEQARMNRTSMVNNLKTRLRQIHRSQIRKGVPA